jgi:hypothetical protein
MKRFFIIVAIITCSLSIVKTSLAQSMNDMPPPPSEGQDGGYVVPKAVTCAKSTWLIDQLEKLEETDTTFIGFVSAEPMGSVILHMYKNLNKGTFSVVESFANGVSCLLTFGYTPDSVELRKPKEQKMKFQIGPSIKAHYEVF